MSQLYSHENLVRIQPLVHKILCRRCRANADANRICTKISCTRSRGWAGGLGGTIQKTFTYAKTMEIYKLHLYEISKICDPLRKHTYSNI